MSQGKFFEALYVIIGVVDFTTFQRSIYSLEARVNLIFLQFAREETTLFEVILDESLQGPHRVPNKTGGFGYLQLVNRALNLT